jgi:hypothetical protein
MMGASAVPSRNVLKKLEFRKCEPLEVENASK